MSTTPPASPAAPAAASPPLRPMETVLHIAVSARISLGLILLGAAVLLLPQGQDVIRGLVEDTNSYLRGTGTGEPSGALLIFQWAAFILACLWTGLNAWYWPRILFRQRVAGKTPTWFKYTLRGIGLLPLFAAMIALLLVARTPDGFRPHDVWIGLVVLALAGVLLGALFERRERLFKDEDAWYNRPSTLLDRRMRTRFGRDPRLRRGDDVFFLASLGSGLVILALLCVPVLRTHVAQALGSAALAFGAIGFLIAFLSTIAWSFGRLRMPVVPTLLVVFVLCSFVNDNHGVRRLGGDERGASPPTVDEALARWEAKNPSGPLILVGAAGGASRAGYWGAAVLRALDERTNGAFGQHVFAISAVSGGSLGAVGYAARLADVGGAGGCFDPAANLAFDRRFVGGDYLAPAIGGMLYPDLIQRFLPFPLFADRATSLEEAWEVGWRHAKTRMPTPDRCGLAKATNRMAEPYDGIWQASLAGRSNWVPLVLVNGTRVENGKRVITAPVKIDPGIFEDSYDFRDLVDRPIRASTAILNGARFPVVSPAGTIVGQTKYGRIVDGGYFENGGLETMLDLARYLRLRTRGQRPIVLVEIDNSLPDDSDQVLADLQRYPNGSSEGQVVATSLEVERASPGGAPFASEVTSIIGGLYRTRTSRGVLAAKRLSGLELNGLAPNVSRITFNLPRIGSGAAMSWTLSSGSRSDIDDMLGSRSTGNVPVAKRVDRALTLCQRTVADALARRLESTRPPLQACDTSKKVAAAVGYPM